MTHPETLAETCVMCGGHPSPTAAIIIAACYFIFAGQVLYAVKFNKRPLDRRSLIAVTALIFAFAFCGVTGYLSALIPDIKEIRGALHWFLAACAALLVITNQGSVIARMLQSDDS